jgi:hypothetical protein
LNLDLDWGKRERLRLRLHRGKAIDFEWWNAMVFQRYWRKRKREECVVEKFEVVVLAYFWVVFNEAMKSN